ncbi:MAG: immunoglobulin domain-containing protein [Clostridia bacterium]|nr:immunoglobulin domain-containing protein [Clostridia bacterium]
MRRLLAMLGALCMLLSCVSGALAEVTITGQPETQTTQPGGSATFTVKARGAGNSGITWHFVSPDGQEDITGRKLSERFPGLKVQNPNTLTIRLKNIPAEMAGWRVHCHIGKAGAGVDTDEALLLMEGYEAADAENEAAETTADADSTADLKDADAEEAGDGAEETGEAEEPDASEASAEEADEAEAESEEEAASTLGAAGPVAAASAEASGELMNPEIRGFDEKAKEEYQFLQLGTYYYEADGTRAPLVWRVLSREGNIAQLITENVIDAMQMLKIEDYDTAVKNKKKFKSRYNTPYEETDIYFWLNGEMAEVMFENQDFSSAIVPHKITESIKGETDVPEKPGYQEGSGEPLTPEEKERFPYGKDLFYIMTYADMKNELFGFPKTHHGNTIENDGERAIPESGRRKAYPTPYAAAKVPYPDWKKDTPNYNLDVVVNYKGMNYGGSSPYWAIKRRPGYYMSGIVGANGHLSWSNMASVRIGVRPATIVDLSKLKVTGGSGTEKDPWIMEVVP